MKQVLGITEQLVRLSIGVENHEDIIRDIEMSLSKV
jgi:cystathionine beta-lyase/cystathionine gamma-synthase